MSSTDRSCKHFCTRRPRSASASITLRSSSVALMTAPPMPRTMSPCRWSEVATVTTLPAAS